MTLDEFTKVIGDEAKTMSQDELVTYYNFSVSFFDLYFDKWKKEKTLLQVA